MARRRSEEALVPAAVGAMALLGALFANLQNDLPIPVRWSVFSALAILLPTAIHYYLTLGGSDTDHESDWRREFVALRKSLEAGGAFNAVYAYLLTRALDALDRFLGDAPGDKSQRLAGAIRTPKAAECWSAAAYDRCLLLALAYPLLVLVVVWAATGHVGDAEQAIGLKESPAGQIGFRLLGLAAVGASTFALWKSARVEGWKRWLAWTAVAVGAVAVAVAVAGAGAVAAAGAGAFAFAVAFAVAVAVAGAVAVAFAGAAAVAGAGAVAGAVAAALIVTLLVDFSKNKGKWGLGLSAITALFFVICFVAACYESSLPGWPGAGALLVFIGLLTLVNAPFDWAAIGLTRFLLRYGIWRGGWVPIALALVDALSAAVSVALLAFACVLAVQLFGDIAALHGGDKARIIHLGEVFRSVRETPTSSSNLWIWFMLFSTAVPSMANLVVACTAVLRSLPFVNRWLLTQMPDGEAMSEPAKLRCALVLSSQWAFGALATFWLGDLLVVWGGPLVAAYADWLAAQAEALARCNWPARVIILWAGGG